MKLFSRFATLDSLCILCHRLSNVYTRLLCFALLYNLIGLWSRNCRLPYAYRPTCLKLCLPELNLVYQPINIREPSLYVIRLMGLNLNRLFLN